ncbi:sodium transporter HKT1 [Trifolium repens]|nr:sodium transporter HKT1 [Trifolium repens]
MVVFRENSGLLLILIPQVLVGNTLYPACLRFCIWVLGKFYKKKECRYLLKHSEEVEGLKGLNNYQKFIGVLFQSVNSRHAGASVVDISILSQAMLVLFVLMMYLPPYTSFLPLKYDKRNSSKRKKLKEDPLNFNVLNIVFEIISAYGNVGLSAGYSCERQLHHPAEVNCENKWIGFVGKWSDEGKIILILVMLFGRLKKFNMDGGKSWKLL